MSGRGLDKVKSIIRVDCNIIAPSTTCSYNLTGNMKIIRPRGGSDTPVKKGPDTLDQFTVLSKPLLDSLF